MGHKILLVEDDKATASYIAKAMDEAGFLVDKADNGRDGLFHASDGSYDAIILDRMLPLMDGMSVLSALRAAKIDTPVIILSALGAPEDRVEGLLAGSDDYLTKPFAFAELLARVRTLLRRSTVPVMTDQIKVADLTLDLPRHRATRAGRKINLSHKEFCLLELLVRRQGEVLPRSLIASQVWDMNFDSDTNVIDVAIRRLRAKIDDDYEPKLIHTVRGMGYKLEVEDDHDEV